MISLEIHCWNETDKTLLDEREQNDRCQKTKKMNDSIINIAKFFFVLHTNISCFTRYNQCQLSKKVWKWIALEC